MDEDGKLSDQVGGIVERHGDEVVEEMVKTVRTVRRFSIGMIVVVGVAFLAMVGMMIWMVSKF
jgi:hypothetical protein